MHTFEWVASNDFSETAGSMEAENMSEALTKLTALLKAQAKLEGGGRYELTIKNSGITIQLTLNFGSK